MKPLLSALLLAILPVAAPAADRIVAIGGAVTETLFALGAGDRVIARDSTSRFPEAALALPDVGYMRQLSAEGVLSVGPDMVITRDSAGPPEVLDQLRATALPLIEVHDGYTAESVLAEIRTIGAAVDLPDKAEALARQEAAAFETLAAEVAKGPHPRVLFVLSDQAGRLTVAGGHTGADGILTLAGATNVMAGSFDGYRILSDEALIAAAPEVILMMTSTGARQMDSSDADILSLPAVARTPAGDRGALVRVDPAALGFGPRTAAFARTLHAALLAGAS
ncbi:ABC transporter substrate-binding protein [Pseudooceanicola sp. CBS1P-1]|uniref:ABC transporter substrate-binding protein n=1 Tax=Pseudooceanicola albus TaxID=2692189 RepID=A0A6L7G012_9RHOB|nr:MULTISPECIES: ABC transporter substrate-binding protein [Pseudooceanicola]MBT9383550.1 ABC transporter substrate-binding protein [Pseudooceanicola endophyticus]MXN17405.1 ABC transporter substrate-binding protein [Pseudooceanicola albus]